MGGQGPPYQGAPKPVLVSRVSDGRFREPSGIDAAPEGIFAITQCQNPLPVGASGSQQVKTIDFVPSCSPSQ